MKDKVKEKSCYSKLWFTLLVVVIILVIFLWPRKTEKINNPENKVITPEQLNSLLEEDDSLIELQEGIASGRQKLEDLTNDIRVKEEQLKTLKSEIEDKNYEIKEKTDESTRLDTLISEKKRTGKPVDVKMKEKTEEYTRLDGQILEKIKISNALDSEIKNKSSKRELLSNIISQMRQTKEVLDSQIKEINDEYRHLDDLITGNTRTNEIIDIRIREKTEKCNRLDGQISEKTRISEDLDSQIKTKTGERDLLDSEILEKVLTNKDLDFQIIEKTGESTRLKNLVEEKMQTSKTIDVQIQEKNNEYNRLDDQISEKTKMNGDLDSQIETKAEKRDILDREISGKVLTNIDLDSQIIKKTGEYTRLKNLVVEKTQASKTIDVQIQKKNNKYNRLDGKILEKTKINDDLDSQIKTKADKRDLLDREISVKTQANDDLDSQISKKTKECTRLKNLVLEKKHISNTIIMQIEKKNKEVSLLDADVNKKREVLKMLNHSIDTKIRQTTSADLTKLFKIKEKLRSLSSFTPDLSLDEEHAVDVYDSDKNLPSQYRPSSNVVGMKNLSELGIKLLRKINSGSISSSNKYQKCFNFIVQQVSNYGGTTNIDVDSIISLTTFLSMYMLVYSEDLPDKLRYHNRIIELIPRIPSIPIPELTSGNSKKEYSAILNLSTPRLLSNYMNNFNDYICDINSIALSKFNSKINSVDGVAFSDHIRQDSSAFAVHSERHVPYVNYSIYLKKVVEEMKFPDLYASVYSVLDIPGNFYDSVKRIVTTIMHPTIKVLQHGLNSSKGDITSEFNWLDVKGKIGCYLIPSIGFGIFKTNQFMFSLRIPMHNIPLSVLSVCNSAELRQCNKFVTSILNLRKIYKTGETYSDYKTWNDICKETGLLIYGGFPMNTFDEYVYSNIGHKTFRTNYVGQLEKNDQVLFWKRSNEAICRSEKEGTTYTVTEVGMFTTEGLEAIYEFSTNRSAGTLKFNYKNDAQSKCLVNNLKNCNQRNDVIEIRLNKDHIASFKWFMPTNHTQKSHDLQFSNGTQTFTYNYHNYKIENMDFDETSFTVKCNNKVILIGNNSPRLKEIIRYDGTDYHRDPETMMYQKN